MYLFPFPDDGAGGAGSGSGSGDGSLRGSGDGSRTGSGAGGAGCCGGGADVGCDLRGSGSRLSTIINKYYKQWTEQNNKNNNTSQIRSFLSNQLLRAPILFG